MANHTLSTDEEGIVAALKMAGYGVSYSVHLSRWMLYRLDTRGTVLSDINKHRFFKECAEWIAKHH